MIFLRFFASCHAIWQSSENLIEPTGTGQNTWKLISCLSCLHCIKIEVITCDCGFHMKKGKKARSWPVANIPNKLQLQSKKTIADIKCYFIFDSPMAAKPCPKIDAGVTIAAAVFPFFSILLSVSDFKFVNVRCQK